MARVNFKHWSACAALAGILIAASAIAVHAPSGAQGRMMGPPMTPAPHDFWSPGWMHRHMWGGRGGMHAEVQKRMQRHWTYMHYGIPAAYRGARSPLKVTPDEVRKGGALYRDNCTRCHGKKGLGDGEAAKGLSPSPALLAYLIQRPVAADEYLLWTIAEGGGAFKTDMPAFKETLAQDDIWRIIAYMRAGFPKVATAEPK
ncbi:MAG: c-type cytochrome [Methyloligellaceae bacterium]